MKMKLDLQLFVGRAQAWNWELSIGAAIPINVQKLGEFSAGGEEGRIEVVDGSKKYKIGDQIYSVDEVETSILVKNKGERPEYDAMIEYAQSSKPRDIFAIARDGEGNVQMTYLFSNCRLAKGKKSAFDRKGKAEETHTFFLLPSDIDEV